MNFNWQYTKEGYIGGVVGGGGGVTFFWLVFWCCFFFGVWNILQVPGSMMTSQMKNPKQEHSYHQLWGTGRREVGQQKTKKMAFGPRHCVHTEKIRCTGIRISQTKFLDASEEKNTNQSLTSRLLKRNHSLAGLKLLNLGFVSHTFLWTWKVHDRHDPSQGEPGFNSALMNHGISRWVIY